MLTAYGAANGCLTEFQAPAAPTVPADSVWLDLVEPTAEEEAAVEVRPRHRHSDAGELAEIGLLRLYQEDGAAFMTANLIRRGEHDEPGSSPLPSSSRTTP